MKILFAAAVSLIASCTVCAQTSQPWQGKKCAVVLTYDDAIDQQLDNAVPILDSLGLKVTFYITAYSSSVQKRLNEWKQLSVRGHELGNHTLFHPCNGGPGREWVKENNDLRKYSVQRMVNETRMTNLFLQSLDGKTRRTFAYTCGDMKIGDSSFIDPMKKDFVAARAVRNEMHLISEVNLYDVDCYIVNGESSAQLIAWAKKAMESHCLLVILFHGVGGGNSLNVSVAAHREFVQFLKQNEKDIMIAPMITVADEIIHWRLRNLPPETTAAAKDSSLKDAFKNDFLIGAALNAQQIQEKDSSAAKLIPAQFNSISPENIMKSAIIHPGWNLYQFDLADEYVSYGLKHNMFIVGHTLIWHSQLSAFVKNINSSDSMLMFMTRHINTVAGRYAGKVNSWDVVNEALNEDGSLRNSVFLKKLGPDYIRKAFDLASKAAPNTELYYNDYNIEQPKKRAGAVRLIKNIKAGGTRIDGVGIQAHWSIYNIPFKDIEESMQEFAALGLKISFTELDLNCLPNPSDLNDADVNKQFKNDPAMNPYPTALPDSIQQQLAKGYEDLFRLFLKYKDNIERVTFWGVSDAHSWLNNWPIQGRTNYPLFFDRNYKPKPAFTSVMSLKK